MSEYINARLCYLYSMDTLRCRFEAGEEMISVHGWHSYYYVRNILHDRFILGEKSISTRIGIKTDYERQFGIVL